MKQIYTHLLLLGIVFEFTTSFIAYRSLLQRIHLKYEGLVTLSSNHKKQIVTQPIMTKIHRKLIDSEYHIDDDSLNHCLQSPNRAHGLRIYYKPGLLRIVNRKVSNKQNFELNLTNEGIYADGKRIFVPEQTAQIDEKGNILRIRHRGFSEEFINSAAGLRQNFIVETAPAGVQKLQVRLVPKGMHIFDAGANELILSQEGKSAGKQLRYRDLKCWDASGKALQSSLAYMKGKIQIDVDSKNAIYPITIDPIIVSDNPTTADVTFTGNQAQSSLGASVSGAGDVNNDGFDDVIVGAPYYDITQPNEGAAFVFYGTPAGIDVISPVKLQIGQSNAGFGTSVANAGDINNDGFGDIVVGAPYFDHEDQDEGAAFVFLGSETGINAVPQAHVEGNFPSANMGIAVACAGKVNADLYDDLIVAAPNWQNDETAEGAAFVFHGSQIGLDPSIKATLETDKANCLVASASCAGDVNNDGYDDVVIGALGYTNEQQFEGAAIVYYGSPSGISLNGKTILEGNQQLSAMGVSVCGVGDVNGDGFDDIAVGASEYSNGQAQEGVVFLFQGSSTGISLSATAILEKNQAGADFGHSVAGLGDLNGDGFNDVAVGAYRYENGEIGEGAAFIFMGSADGLKPTNLLYESNESYSQFGISIKCAGDIDGDGINDVIIGAPYHGETYGGAAFIFGSLGNSFPVTLVNFSAQVVDNSVELAWSTNSEINADRFEIQRLDLARWNSIGKVAANENTTTLRQYTFIDIKPLQGENLYRLKMIDKDETFTFSSIRVVRFEGQNSEKFIVYPSPGSKTIKIKSIAPDLLRFLDMSGRQVSEIKFPRQNEDIDISFLPTGLYSVVARFSNGRTVTQKLVVRGD